jgi:heme/copper-type cytochrome/quinol oxidase subunit 1
VDCSLLFSVYNWVILNQTFPFLEDFLGHWAKGGKLDPEFYYALVTMHGTVLVFFVLTAGLSGTFANFLIPLQIGARDMASPMLNMLSLLVLLPGRCYHDVFHVCTNRTCKWWLDDVSATECAWVMHHLEVKSVWTSGW